MKRYRTKELLALSFLELARTKSIDKITIHDITSNVEFSAATFYNHFQDKYDLLTWMYKQQAKTFFDRLESGASWKDILSNGVDEFLQYKDFALNAYHHTNGADSFLRNVQKINGDYLKEYLSRKAGYSLGHRINALIEVYCYGYVEYFFYWLVGRHKATKEELVDILYGAIPEKLKPFLR